ncbi:MAG: ABC transporter ATP-binding protein [Desulfobacterales bacterium]|nr:ABC transporter ATP-binding protein [Desulfobacterales bacterium]
MQFKVSNLCAGYGHVQVLNQVALSMDKKEILVILGRNGMGKTTLMRTIMGSCNITAGRVCIDDQELTRLQSFEIARAGIAYVPQGRRIFPKLTVKENLIVGTRSRVDGKTEIPEEVWSYFPILHDRQGQLGGTLSGGQQQQLAIARALCGNPRILLLDEPSEGIQPNLVQLLGRILLQIVKETDLAVLLVEQNLDLILQTASRYLVMEKGTILHAGGPEELKDEKKIGAFLTI